MKIRLGYVALPLTIDETASSALTYTNYSKLENNEGYEKLDKVIVSNFLSLEQILLYNIKNNIHFFRLTSKLIPLATKEDVVFDYIDKYKDYYSKLAKLINNNDIRIDVHPDQFTVLNSVKKEVINNSINNLEYHYQILNALGIYPIIILHVGSSVFGKEKAMKRFIYNFRRLDKNIKKAIVLENDDKIYNALDVLEICNKLKIPMVLDYHHFLCNNNGEKIEDLITLIFDTWNDVKMRPKIHFSSPKNKTKKDFRSHNDYIDINEFINFIEKIKFCNRDFDIMLEAKMKDVALFRLIRQLKYLTNYEFIDETTFIVK